MTEKFLSFVIKYCYYITNILTILNELNNREKGTKC